MRKVCAIAFLALIGGCSHPSDVDRFKTVAVIEVPLQTTADQDDLVAIMRRMAAANGMHVDDDSQNWMDFQKSIPANGRVDTRATIYVGVWRGSRDDDFEASVSDMFHLRRAWVTFLQGGDADLPAQTRQKVLVEIKQR